MTAASAELEEARRDLENLDALYRSDPSREQGDPERFYGEAHDLARNRARAAAAAYVAERGKDPKNRADVVKRRRARIAGLIVDGLRHLLAEHPGALQLVVLQDGVPEQVKRHLVAYARSKVPDPR